MPPRPKRARTGEPDPAVPAAIPTSSVRPPQPVVTAVHALADAAAAEAVVVVAAFEGDLADAAVAGLNEAVVAAKALDKGFLNTVSLAAASAAPGGRAIFSPLGNLNRDYDDVRRVQDAAHAGVQRAFSAGAKSIALHVELPPQNKLINPTIYTQARVVAITSALAAAYLPLEAREHGAEQKLTQLFVVASDSNVDADVSLAVAIESGRAVARDIGGSDPERMAAPAVSEYVQQLFKGTDISVTTEEGYDHLKKEYPLLAGFSLDTSSDTTMHSLLCLLAVSRASIEVERHRPVVIHLEYVPKVCTLFRVFFVGHLQMQTAGLGRSQGDSLPGW